jgi:deazaflavin-dependent oxidoreductase (nitroreductase family)
MSDFNQQVIDEFRTNGGIVGGHFEGKDLLLLHTVGRRTGLPRVNPLVYANDGTGFVVAASNGGAHGQPQWVANVEAMSQVTIEVGERTLTARVSVLREGTERDRAYAKLVDYWPDFLEYETKTARKFPVIRLEPSDAEEGRAEASRLARSVTSK